MHLPLIVTLVITLKLDQVLQSVVTHVAVQDSLNLILLLTIDESCGWRRRRSSAKDRIRRGRGQLDYRENGVKAAEVGGAKLGGMRQGRHRLRRQRGLSVGVTA
jgi:hypothetical protein